MVKLITAGLMLAALALFPVQAGRVIGAPASDGRGGGVVVQGKGDEAAPVLQALERVVRAKGYGRAPGSHTWQRLTSWKTEGCRVRYVITDEEGRPEKIGEEPSVDVARQSSVTFGLDLGDLDPRLVEANPYKGIEGGAVSYRTEGERKLIKFEARYLRAADNRSRGWLILKDRESLDEAAALLRQAVEICRR